MIDINHIFESQMEFVYDNGVFWFSGRDIVAILIGINIGIILMLTIQLLKCLVEKENKQ
ncbi:MAG: hypothetical protein J5725_13005 [Bacteroidales bacterium]|nr:hypothetical protein [Bacteroidales bacterium]